MIRRRTQAVYVISVAAELAGMHPQTLRIYERRGLVQPARTEGGNRRYSDADIEVLRRIAELAESGMNLEGIRRVMELEAENERLKAELADARREADQAATRARESAQLVPLKQALAVFGETPSFLRGRDQRVRPTRVPGGADSRAPRTRVGRHAALIRSSGSPLRCRRRDRLSNQGDSWSVDEVVVVRGVEDDEVGA